MKPELGPLHPNRPLARPHMIAAVEAAAKAVGGLETLAYRKWVETSEPLALTELRLATAAKNALAAMRCAILNVDPKETIARATLAGVDLAKVIRSAQAARDGLNAEWLARKKEGRKP